MGHCNSKEEGIQIERLIQSWEIAIMIDKSYCFIVPTFDKSFQNPIKISIKEQTVRII
jgi:hypothetical protein